MRAHRSGRVALPVAGALAVALLVLACASREAGAGPTVAPKYPAARTVDVVDDYHGTLIADPYRWMEELESPEVRRWAAEQTALADTYVRASPLRPWLLERLRKLSEPWDVMASTDATRVAGREFVEAVLPGAAQAVLSLRDGAGATRVLLDPAAGGADRRLDRFTPAPDGRHVVCEISTGGSEWVETRIVRVQDAQLLPETIDGLLWAEPLWSADGSGFFYVHQIRPRPGDSIALRGPSVRFHALGTAQAADRVLFATPADSTQLVLEIQLTADGRYLLISEGTGAHWEGFAWVLSRLHVLDLGDGGAPDLSGPLLALTPERDFGYSLVASDGPVLYLLTDRGAPRKRLVAVDLREPSPERWREVIPESRAVLMHVQRIGARFVAVGLLDVQPVVRVFDADGRLLRELPQPPCSSVHAVAAGELDSELDVTTSSFLFPMRIERHDLASGAARVIEELGVDADVAPFETEQLWFTSKDGTRVPMFVVRRKDLVRDGSHPALLYGYGASGTSVTPSYDESVLAWLELGGVFAAPSLRGGGEFGRDWYEAATRERKQTTCDDFIAAAEHLVAQGYTSASRLAIRGASSGGLLVGMALTQRPDLFAVAIPEVPHADSLRGERGRHVAQYGDASDPQMFPFLRRSSPLHNVRAGTCYPATLIVAAMNDDRAPAWHALKFAAALQAAQSCARPILLRAGLTGGHALDSSPDSFVEKAADELSFAAQVFGMSAPPRSGDGD